MHKDRKLNRLQGYDYSRNAMYFVTSCVENRNCFFGEIRDDKMVLNNYGKIAEQQLVWLEQQYKYVDVHAFIVMPNHIHGIIEINDALIGTGRNVGAGCDVGTGGNVGTGRDLSLRQQQETKIKSLSQLMGAYKTTSSKQIHLAGLPEFKWQRSFHDHIIRNEEAFFRIPIIF